MRVGRWVAAMSIGLGAVVWQGSSVGADASMSISGSGRLDDGGSVAVVQVRVACDPVDGVTQPLEAFLTLSQDDQTITGMGGISDIVCDGKSRRHAVRVTALEGAFHRGTAHGSGFVLICNETGSTCEQAQASRDLNLVGVTG